MDDKYTKIGKFATLTSKHPLTANPSVAPSVKSAIPILHEHSVLKGSKREQLLVYQVQYYKANVETQITALPCSIRHTLMTLMKPH